jgi:hypothetical protein
MIRWNGEIYLVHRTANAQILGPNSSLHIYKSTDEGASFQQIATILAPPGATDSGADAGTADAGPPDVGFDAPTGRDIRDPAFFIVGDTLHFKAITRTPCPAAGGIGCAYDSDVNSITVESHSTDGVNWSPLTPIAPVEWGFWRPKERNGVWYAAAYHDGDSQVALFSSSDGVTWTQGAEVYSVSTDGPLETELTFMPSGRLLALVRMDGGDEEGDNIAGLKTGVCWSLPPYASFSCGAPLTEVRLDGPLSFFYAGRLFVVAREHFGESDDKATALYEITGNLEGGPIGIKKWLDFPSSGDTSYAGGVELKDGSMMFSWYSSRTTYDPANLDPAVIVDPPWLIGQISAADIWLGTVKFQAPN